MLSPTEEFWALWLFSIILVGKPGRQGWRQILFDRHVDQMYLHLVLLNSKQINNLKRSKNIKMEFFIHRNEYFRYHKFKVENQVMNSEQ
jgi:hypothetical protein